MRITKFFVIGLIVSIAILAATLSGRAAPLPHPTAQLTPIVITDDTFDPADWQVYDLISQGGSTYQIRQEASGGDPGAYRWIEHVIPPVPSGQIYKISLTHLYLGAGYDPASQGPIASLDYAESSRILATNHPQPFIYSFPILVQGGRIYRTKSPLDSTETTAWESQSAAGLTYLDFIAFDNINAHPDFSSQGQPISFGFFRGHSRTQTGPTLPTNQNLTIQHGIDNWSFTINRNSNNQAPLALSDTYVLDAEYLQSEPAFLYVLANDSDPDGDTLQITAVTTPTYGGTSLLSSNTILYFRSGGATPDDFEYTISDGYVTRSASVQIFIDCGCSLLCFRFKSAGQLQAVDLNLIYRLRDEVMKPTPDGNRYVEMYYTTTPEIVKILMLDQPTLGDEAVALVELWQDNLYSLVDGDGSAVITQAQVDAIETFLANLSAAGSADLQQLIADEQTRLGPLDDYVGLTVKEAKSQAIGAPMIYLPIILR